LVVGLWKVSQYVMGAQNVDKNYAEDVEELKKHTWPAARKQGALLIFASTYFLLNIVRLSGATVCRGEFKIGLGFGCTRVKSTNTTDDL